MNVLITNDDGYKAKGIIKLAEIIHELGWDATIVAPKKHMSGAARSRMSGVNIDWLKSDNVCGFPVYFVDGTPAACVVFALTSGLFDRFDYCISGINAGENLGSGLTISGTFGAALESADLGVKGIALSRKYEDMKTTPEDWEWNYLSKPVKDLLLKLVKSEEEWKVANVNFPNNIENYEYIKTKVSSTSYFSDRYDLETSVIRSGVGYNLDDLELDDDIFAFAELNRISVTFLTGQLK
jgi:5'/3'-nucleotidase SurE